MSRRWIPRRTEPDTAEQPAVESVEQALITSITTNRELRAELDAAEKKLAATETQLEFHKNTLVQVRTELAGKAELARQLDQYAASLLQQLKVEREHTAGSCSHAAELKAMGMQVGALEKRVHELQRINQGYDARGMVSQPEPEPAAKKWRVL